MPKRTYTPEEVQKIEKTLLIEKQRVRDLESKVASFLKSKQGEEEEESETLRLRRMVITFKKKYQQLLHELSQKRMDRKNQQNLSISCRRPKKKMLRLSNNSNC